MPCHRPKRLPAVVVPILFAMVLLPMSHHALADPDVDKSSQEILDLNLEDLLNMEVTSVSKRAQLLSSSAAAIHVVTDKDIKQSGVTSVPEALRLVPGLHVARIDSNKWAITSRGFNGRFSNKLLVLIDGRSVYTPTFSGVYWEVQDTLLEDIERIEVIRGPGATLWGANAVNGVINIITRHSADTQGGLLSLGSGGNEQRFGGLRYGTAIGENGYGRVFIKHNKRGSFDLRNGSDAKDDWEMDSGGFRVDAQHANNSYTIEGQLYRGDIYQTLTLPSLDAPFFTETYVDKTEVSGWHTLGRWRHALSALSELELQIYYDHTEREEAFRGETRDTFDIEFQHRLLISDNHDLLWGMGYRNSRDHFTNSIQVSITPSRQVADIYNAFIQDEITLSDVLTLTLGSKFEHNSYSGFEIQPSARLMWSAHENHKLWASLSRAVRSSSRAEQDASFTASVIPPSVPGVNPSPLPVAITLNGNHDYDSEDVTAFELGYRTLPHKQLSLDLALFYNDYRNLRGLRPANMIFPQAPGQPIEQPIYFNNSNSATTKGYELSAVWQTTNWWRQDLSYSYLDFDSGSASGKIVSGSPPRHQLSLRSALQLSPSVDVHLWWRYIDSIANPSTNNFTAVAVKSYTAFDARIAWRPHQDLELSVVGQNLLDDGHTEFVQESFTDETEIQRSVYIKAELRF